MKVLFVCRGNVARSQMAARIYNELTKSTDAASAGTHVEVHGESLGARKKRVGKSHVVDVMNDNNLSIDDQRQTQLTKEMLPKYDVVISMAGKRYTPAWLNKSKNYVYWKIRDPKGLGYEVTNRTRVIIESHIRELLAN